MRNLQFLFVRLHQTLFSLFGVVFFFCFSLQGYAQGSETTGLHGYFQSGSQGTPPDFVYGIGFYSSVWRLTPQPLANFQMGLPGTWISPDNSDNTTEPLCPIGTYARDNWPGTTYDGFFQIMEGGLGYWIGTRFHYGPPKYSMNSTPNCYSNQIASPGWDFFSQTAIPDELLAIAQLSNRIIIPPDGLTFKDNPHGEFIGYSYLALPFTDPRAGETPVGNNNWTLFLNAKNFKGPIAYYVPETWSKISENYPFDHGRGLDSRPTRTGAGGAIEIAEIPILKDTANNGTLYTKIPRIQFPVDENGKTVFVRDLAYFSKDALYNDIQNWRDGGMMPTGKFNSSGINFPDINTPPSVHFNQERTEVQGINEMYTITVFEDNAWGLVWEDITEDGFASFPQYYKAENGMRVAVDESEIPEETSLKEQSFSAPKPIGFYKIEQTGAWANPGPSTGPFNVELVDGSIVTYYWYRFIDQPIFQQYDWSEEEKNELQQIVEAMHANWTIDKEYMNPITDGELVSFDSALIVTPPPGFEVGYVPIVTRQSALDDVDCSNYEFSVISSIVESPTPGNSEKNIMLDIDGTFPPYQIKWSSGSYGFSSPVKEGETYHAVITDSVNCRYYHYSPPIALIETGLDENSFYASWVEVPGAKSYEVDVALDSSFTEFLEDWDGQEFENETKVEVNLTTGELNYFYRVRAVGYHEEISTNSNIIHVDVEMENCRLDGTVNKKNISSAASADGEASVIIKGGMAPYTYAWSNGENQSEIKNLTMGGYSVTVTDAQDCQITEYVTIGLPIGSNSIGNRVWNDLNQNGFDDFNEPGIEGVTLVLVRDDVGSGDPDTFKGFAITNANGYYTFTNLNPGLYEVFVWELDNWEMGEPLYGMVNTINILNPNNNIDGDNNGNLELPFLKFISKPIEITTDGEPLMDGDRQDDQFDYDPSGNMTIDFGFYHPGDCPMINAQIRGTEELEVNETTGYLEVYLASGLGPYQYLWNTGADTKHIENLGIGTYEVNVTDVNGCVGSASFKIDSLINLPDPSDTIVTATEKVNSDQILIYPNPTQQILNIDNQLNVPLNLKIYNLQGTNIMKKPIYQGLNQISLTLIPNGIYIINLIDKYGGVAYQDKLIKVY